MFETRMRTLVREILEPIIERNDQEAEKYLQLDKRNNLVQKRIEILEYAVLNEPLPTKKQKRNNEESGEEEPV